MIGRTISHYRVVDKLGEGGMGIVYKAWDLRLERGVALKFLPARVDNDERRERFLREARAAAALDHPNICTVYEIDDWEGCTFLAMALAEGFTLRHRTERGPLDLDEALDLGIQIARGIEAAHSRGIIHRDIKSANILVSNGLAKITDFGLAIAVGTAPEVGRSMLGTPAYVSPEQIRGREVDHRTDLWSWGVVSYEMLTGRLPFEQTDAPAVIRAILRDDPCPPSGLRSVVPPELDRIVLKALTRDPNHRYAGARALLEDLESFRAERESTPATLEPVRELPSIAVMPFVDKSPEQDQQHFCEGVAEEILLHLGRVKGLRVVSRASSFALHESEPDARRVGRRLEVDTVLAGTVSRAGRRLRIRVELIAVSDGYQLWSGQYDRELRDIFGIQEGIARSIAGALRIELDDAAHQALGRVPTRDVEAYDLYLRGRQYFYRSKRSAIEFALEMFSRAVERDSEYALAHAGMADCHSYLFMYFDPVPSNLERAGECSERAIHLDPTLAEAHAARGLAVSLRNEYSAAESEFEAALRLDPRLFEASYFYARTCFAQGKLRRAAELFRRASRVNHDDYQAVSLLGLTYRMLGRDADAREAYRTTLARVDKRLELNPDDARATYLGATALFELGEEAKAVRWADRAYAIEPDDPYNVYGTACFYSRLGRPAKAMHYFATALELGFAHRDWIDNDADLDPLRDEPGFPELLRKHLEP